MRSVFRAILEGRKSPDIRLNFTLGKIFFFVRKNFFYGRRIFLYGGRFFPFVSALESSRFSGCEKPVERYGFLLYLCPPLNITISMWLLLAFCSAALLGFYDVFKKKSLSNNAVLPVLGLNTLFSSMIFLPFIVISAWRPELLSDTLFFVPRVGWDVHKFILLKSFIVLSSWVLGYFGMKHLPLTIVGPINATRPVMTLVGAMLLFGERLNAYQWVGVVLAVVSFFMLSRSGKKEGIDFKHDRWIWFIVLAAVLGAVSGLYDKYLMSRFSNMVVQSWYNVYQLFIMGGVLMLLWLPKRRSSTPFHWNWCIIFISVFLSAADFVYFYALGMDGAMISIVSMVRRGSVIVSFLFGAMMFREKNLTSKAVDLALVLIGMFFLYLGSR